MDTRRDFLKMAALLSGVVGVSSFLPDSVQRAYAIAPEPGTTWADAEHVVLLMQENRSFDHALGTLRGVRGFNDPRAFRLPNGNSVFVQTDAAGNSYAPWRLNIKDTRITWMGSLHHSRQSQVDAWNDGWHDGWLEAKRPGKKEYAHMPLTMGYYTREDLPFYYALADAFTVCDQNYCSVLTSTSPNRCYFWSGTIRDEKNGVHVRNEVIDDGGLRWKTFPERLQEAGVSWKAYQNELTNADISGQAEGWLSNYGDNTLECFAAYHVEAYPGAVATKQRRVKELSRDAEKLEASLAKARGEVAAADLRRQLELVRSKIEVLKTAIAHGGEAKYRKLTAQEKALHHAALTTNTGDTDFRQLDSLPYQAEGKRQTMRVPKGDIFYQFRKDVNEGKLPTISWLTAPENFSDHPSAPWYGAWYVSEVMDILTKNPEVWKKTIFILTYDENDGYFDHAPCYVAADPKRPETGGASEGVDTEGEFIQKDEELRMGTPLKDARTGPIGMGFRVPMIVASPWSRGGWVNSQLFDHTSTLMFLERFVAKKFGKHVREENISEWRRTVAGDMTSIFRPYNGKKDELEYLDRDKFVIGIEQARFKDVPTNYTRLDAAMVEAINRGAGLMAQQEKGTKPACALPYELYADGGVSEDGKYFELRLRAGDKMHGARSAGAAFNVYLRGAKFQAATYAVKAGDTVVRRYPMSMFDGIEVHAPNGFYRSFTGAMPVQASVEYAKTGDVMVRLRNLSAKAVEVVLVDNAYKAGTQRKRVAARGRGSVVVPLRKSFGWYDFSVKVDGGEARFAGRVETGRSSMTDPVMGGVV
ncbi:MAG: phospholipase C, phosphocholine-specific [Acidobacteria bacterium]|nr:phospholipase C, phosphocholine-specific [Acidobacteriota bacterium]